MGIKYSFVDSVVYGTEDINDITRGITGAGVAPFASKDTYNTSDINAMTQALVEAGVQLGGCKCSVKNAGTAEMSVELAQGIVFFESGVRLEIDAEGYVIVVQPNTAGYVFANYRPALQKVEVAFAAELPENGETVILAQILQNGTIRDMRSFARSKIATVGTNVLVKRPFERLEEPVLINEPDSYGDAWYITAKITGIDLSKFNYAVLVATNQYGDVFKYFPSLGYSSVFFDIKNQKVLFGVYDGETIVSGNAYIHNVHSDYVYYLELIGGELCIVCRCAPKDKGQAIYYTLGCTICLM